MTGMFKDPAFEVKSAVDKRGRKLGKQIQKEDLRKYYRLQNEEVRLPCLDRVAAWRPTPNLLRHHPMWLQEDWGRKPNMTPGEAGAFCVFRVCRRQGLGHHYSRSNCTFADYNTLHL